MDANHSDFKRTGETCFIFFLSPFTSLFKHVRERGRLKNLASERFPSSDKPRASDSWRGRRLTIQTRSHGHQLTQHGKKENRRRHYSLSLSLHPDNNTKQQPNKKNKYRNRFFKVWTYLGQRWWWCYRRLESAFGCEWQHCHA